MDRRAAQSVPNIFFKHKKLQTKQISDKVNLAIKSKKISNDQELIQSDPISCPQNQKGNN